MVMEVKHSQGLPFVLALYQVMDELSALARPSIQPPLACCATCSFCCHQMVTCTKMEWRVIHEYLIGNGLLRKLVQRLRAGVERWLKYYSSNRGALEQNPFKLHADHKGQACIYLNQKGCCDIYPVRPMDCRIWVSTIKCGPGVTSGARRAIHPWEEWANSWLLEENARSTNQGKSVTPLPHWLATIKF